MYITFRYVYYIYICVLWPVTRSLSDRIGKVVASHAAVARSIPSEVALIYNMHETFRGYCRGGWRVPPVNWIYRL